MLEDSYVSISRTASKRGIEEKRRCEIRVRECGDKFFSVQNKLKETFAEGMTIRNLLAKAKELTKYNEVNPVDRDARRSKKSLICWYVENWKIIEPYCTGNINHATQASESLDNIAVADEESFGFEIFDVFIDTE